MLFPFPLRLLCAIFLPFSLWTLSWMASSPILFILSWIALIPSYFYPAIEAAIRKAPNTTQVAVLNLFLGWTLIGWVVALVWAIATKEVPAQEKTVEKEPPYAATSGVPSYQPTLPDKPQADAVNTRACPFCAEEILKAAIICKHCKSNVSQAV